MFAERNLLAATQQVASRKGAAGVDHVSVDEFVGQVPETLWQLSDALKAGTYRPQAIRRVHIPKPGPKETRPLGIPTVRDRRHGRFERHGGTPTIDVQTLRGKTRRTSGESFAVIVGDVNRTLRGGFEYFRHSSHRNVFQDVDGWLPRRLRSLLRPRCGGRGRGRGADHHRWPNGFFHAHGLLSLRAAGRANVQPS